MVIRVVSLVVCLLVLGVASISVGPSSQHHRPAVPSAFHASVSATFKSDGVKWKGGGLFALDAEKGFARTDLLLVNDKRPNKLSIHTLDRYDLQSSFKIDAPQFACTKSPVVGAFENPLAWIANATRVGISLFDDTWEFKAIDAF